MASAYINISPTANIHSGELYSFISQLRQLVEQSQELKDRYDQMAMGGDFAALAGYLDLSEADATAIYNLLGSANTELHGTFTLQMLSRCG